MINMMYLVLTAMLALNVAAETLQAFKVIDASLMKTYKSFSEKNAAIVRDFERAAGENEEKVGHWRDLAKEVHAKSDTLVNFIIETKKEIALAAKAEKLEGEIPVDFPLVIGTSGDTLVLKSQDDLNATPQVMLMEGRGTELQKKILGFREELISLVGDFPALTSNLNGSLSVDDPEKSDKLKASTYRTWVQQNFESSPVIASIALLSKLQIDVRNAESAVLSHLYSQIDAASFKFSGLQAQVIPNTKYVIQGQKYEAKIFLSAVDNTQDLAVYMNGSSNALPVVNGEAIYSVTPNTPGPVTYKGEINFVGPNGPEKFPFSGEYLVAPPAVTVSPTKMNVLYRSLPNPISVSVPGTPTEKLEVTFTNGRIEKTETGWVAYPDQLDPKGEKTKIIVKVKEDGGQVRNMGELIFRVKKVPDPKATVAGISSGGIAREKLRVQQLVSATLEDFDFDLSFVVTSFDMSVPTSGGETTTLHSGSYKFTDDMKRLLNGLGSGSKVSIENIKAKIDGDAKDPERTIPPVILTVQ
jgi:gliding motility-associated protein GldM